MGKRTQTRTNELLDQQRTTTQNDYSDPLSTSKKRSAEAYKSKEDMLPGLRSRYESLADNGGLDPDDYSSYRSNSGGGGDPGNLGIDESKFSEALKGYHDFASGGGVDVEGLRARANSVIPSFYKNMENESSRRRLVNPYSPSFDAETASRARQAGQQSVENVRDTELDIGEKVNANKKFGIAGMGSLQQAIQEMQQRGRISGAGLAESAAGRRSNSELAILEAKQRGRLTGLGGLENLYSTGNQDAKDYSNQEYGGLSDRTGGTQGSIVNRQNTTPWWQTVLQAGAGAAGAYAGAQR